MQFSKITIIVLILALCLISCSMKQHSFAVISSLPKANNKFTSSITWRHSVGNGIGEYYSQLSPTYNNSVIYAADRKGKVEAINIHSGKIFWSVNLSRSAGHFIANLPALLSGGLTVSGDKIYIGTETGKVIALNKTNGKVIWETMVSGEVLSKPAISNNLVLIHTGDDVLQALDTNTGKNKWSISLGNVPIFSIRGRSTPAIAYGTAIVGSNGGRISAIAISQGEIIWQQCISKINHESIVDRLHDISATPIIDINLGIIFAVAYNGMLAAIDLRSGRIIWTRNLGSVNDMADTKDIIYLVDQSDRLLAISKSSGVTLWVHDTLLHRNLTAPALYKSRYLIVNDQEGYVHWLDALSGQFITQKKISNSGLCKPVVIANNNVLIQAKNGVVYLIKCFF